jgi:hypothetical protein
MHVEYRAALVKLRAFVGGNVTMQAEDIVRTAIGATCQIADARFRTELGSRLACRLIAFGMTPPHSRHGAGSRVEAVLDEVERLSR